MKGILNLIWAIQFIMLSTVSADAVNISARTVDSLITIRGEAQGTTYQIRYYSGKNLVCKSEIDSILQRIDKSLSGYRTDSEIADFNKDGQLTFRSAHFFPVLKKSKEVFLETKGLFDPTVLPLVEAYGFGKKKKTAQFDLDSILQYIGFQYLQFDSIQVKSEKQGVRIDFNAIAQGYSVDVVADFLGQKGIQNYVVEIGGEMRWAGQKDAGHFWKLGIENPTIPGQLCAMVEMKDMAMATSGNYRNQYVQDGIRYSHIINPKTGIAEASSVLNATVFAADAMTADAFATAFVLMDIEESQKLLTRRPDLNVFIQYSDASGNIRQLISPELKNYITFLKP